MRGLGLVGYVDRWSASAGEIVTFFVSSQQARYRTQLVRLRHGGLESPDAAANEQLIAGELEGVHDGFVQDIAKGSCMRVEGLPTLSSWTFATWVWPTLSVARDQCLASRIDPLSGVGYALLLNSQGVLTLRASAAGKSAMIQLQQPLALRRWAFVAATVTGDGMHLYWRTREFSPVRPMHDQAQWRFNHLARYFACSAPLLLGSSRIEPAGTTFRPHDCFNGKLSAPRFFDRALSSEEVDRLSRDDIAVASTAIAAWDFIAEAGGTRVPDASGNRYDGHTLNRPTRFMTGHNFSGRTLNPREAPAEFNAVHFHDDDLADAGWMPSFRFKVPPTLRSGVYAAKLTSAEHCDYVPFVVKRHVGQTRAPIVFLLPTVSYAGYANSSLDPAMLPPDLTPIRNVGVCGDARAYAKHYGLLSTYDRHTDGSGVCMSTMLRPMPIFVRPGSRSLLNGGAHQLGADLHVIDWLEANGLAYDVITDHDLDREGLDALHPYRAVISGTHAEYWTANMLDALDGYTQSGGRFVYLSGNGLYWITALNSDQTLVEIRRVHGTRSWNPEPGEGHLSLTGEPGGLWRHRGRAPQRYVGVGFAAQGFDRGRPYQRTPHSADPRARFIFEGVADELIGDFAALVSEYGAAGFEVDRADTALGTPEHALILATAEGFSDCYQNAVEEAGAMTPHYGGTTCANVRADMVFFETPLDGAVFSTGSIAWCSALSHNNYDNNVSRIMYNVVAAFSSPGPLPGARRVEVKPAPISSTEA